jgi:hypothetical protein
MIMLERKISVCNREKLMASIKPGKITSHDRYTVMSRLLCKDFIPIDNPSGGRHKEYSIQS